MIMMMMMLRQLRQMPHMVLCALAISAGAFLACAAGAQDQPAARNIDLAPFQPAPVAPLQAGETKVLEAVIIDVKGRARWRPGEAGAWKPAEVDDMLKPGAEISTGLGSAVTLRVGHNATIYVDAQSRFSLPDFVQVGDTLRSRAGVRYGRVDFKVDRVGLTNDFVVVTPTATLAVPGTGFSIIVSSLDGLQVLGVRENMIRAIELSYFFRKIRVYLSGQGKSSQRYPDPVLAAMHDTLSPPAVWAAGLEAVGELENGFKQDLFAKQVREIESGLEQQEQIREIVDQQEPFDPTEGFFGDFDEADFFEIAVFICDFQSEIFGQFEDQLRADGNFKGSRFESMRSEIESICDTLHERDNPLFDLAFEVVTYCQSLNKSNAQNECLVAFVEAFGESFNRYHDLPGADQPKRRNKRRKR